MELLGCPIFTLMILVSLQGFATSVECDSEHFQVGDHCCARCPPGYFRHRDCDYGTPTHCLPCPPGTYTEHTNYLDRCRLCAHCSEDHGMEERRACLPNQNRRCRCMKGFFLHPGEVPGRNAHMCYRHQQCQPGEGVKKEGTRRTDTTCAPCAMGMFSQGGNHTCQDWTDCESQGLKEMIPGTTEHDAVCDYIPPVSLNVTVPQVSPTVGGGVTLGSVSDRMETPGKPVPDGYDLQLSPSTTNPLQHSPSGNKREGAGTSAVSHLLKKGNDTPTTLAVAIVGLLLLVGCIGVTVYCGYVRFIKEKGGRGERIRGVSVAYHAQIQAPEDTVSLTETCVVDQGTAVSAEPQPPAPTGQRAIAPSALQWPPHSSEIPTGTRNEGAATSDPPQIVFNIDNRVITAYQDNSTTIHDSSNNTTVQDCENVLLGENGTINVTSNTSDSSTTVEGNSGGVQIGNNNNM